jgi:hypothetical protein
MSHSAEYSIWQGMIRRCTNSRHNSYIRYGGRGIEVCDRWRDSFENFYADMGKRPPDMSLDRRDNNGDYEPGNCRWATRTEQMLNTGQLSSNTSGVKGVGQYRRLGLWRAYIQVNKQHISLGYFPNIDDAIKARREAELRYA